MIILGIDPGLTRLGYGFVEKLESRNVALVEVGVLTSDAKSLVEARIGKLAAELEELIATRKPQAIAIERLFAQSNLRSVMGVAQISGVVLLLAHRHRIPITFYTPTQVKLAVTGSGRADKAQVGFMVAKILKLKEIPKPADAADSLAIAICHAWNEVATVGAGVQATEAQKKWLAALAKAKQSKG